MIVIKELDFHMVEDFFIYLDRHISENGRNGNTLYFPLSSNQSFLSKELMTKLKEGINKSFGELGWRKVWIAIGKDGEIIGHIDLRHNNLINSKHRVLLGMGVDSKHRNLKVGENLIKFVIEYCRKSPNIDWIDLEVMASNLPAKNLYEKMNFQLVSTTKDMFRIDNNSFDYSSMTLNVEQ